MKTSNANLQNKLDTLVQLMDASLAEESKTPARLQKLMIFTDAFVPPDVQPEDIAYFSDNLYQDEEYLQSMRREVGCCASGELIESITGNQRTKAVFTILPPEGTLSEGSSLDIVREVAFISADGGNTWTAEG